MNGPKPDFEPEELAMIEELGLTRAPADCPTPARLQAFAIHALPDDQIDRLARHLAECPLCRLLTEDYARMERPDPEPEAVDKLWRRMQPALLEARPKPHWPRWWTRIAWAMAPVAAAALLVLAAHSPALRLPTPVAVSILDYQQAAPVKPAPIVVALEELLTWRGAETGTAQSEAAAAFGAYQRGDYVEAARLFGAMASQDSRKYRAVFYQGVALLLADRPSEAIAPLERAKLFGETGERSEAQWYLGLARVHAGDPAQGRHELDELCLSGTGHAQDACQVLRRLASLEAALKHN